MGTDRDMIHPQGEGHDEMLVEKEQHAALDPNRLRRKSLEALVTWGIVGGVTVCKKVEGWGKNYMITHLQQLLP